MSRILCSLAGVCLTLALVSFGGGFSSASDSPASDPSDGSAPTNGFRHPPIRLIKVAKKKTRKKAAPKKGEAKGEMTEPAEKEAMPAPAVAAKGTEGDGGGLKFSRDIAPILVGNCLRCHNEQAAAKNGKLDLTTYEKIRKGAASEEIIVPGKPEESHLYLRLTGEETPKMPRQANQRPLSENAIERVGQWIKEGATLDAGKDPKAKIDSYATTPDQLRRDALAKLSTEERDKLVVDRGNERWKKGNAKEAPEATPGKNFLLIGRLPKDRVTSTLKLMDAQYPQLRSFVTKGGPADSLEKIGLYVFNDRTSFVEFVRSNEGREIESTEQGSANFSDTEPYVVVVDPLGGNEDPTAGAPKKTARSKKGDDDAGGAERSLAGLLVEHTAIGILKSGGSKAPAWLTMGVGAYFGSRIDSRSPNTARLRKDAYDQWEQGWNSKANDALGGETKLEDIRAVGFAIVEAIATTQRPALPAFVHGMLEGGDKLDDTLQKVFGVGRDQFLQGTGAFIEESYAQYARRRR